MMIYSDRHIPVATTPDEFNACWASIRYPVRICCDH